VNLKDTFPASGEPPPDERGLAPRSLHYAQEQAKPMHHGEIFKVGDHVSWNSEAGRVTGRIVRVHSKDVTYKGYGHHASPDDPQYEIKSDKTDHVALHRGRVLGHLRH